jgi:hypothetical protein
VTGLVAVGLILSFLPFLVSLGGRGIWKFLSFLSCLLAAIGAVPTFGLSIICWMVGWIFAGIAISNRKREDRFDRIERALTDRPSPAVVTSPVEMLLANAQAKPMKGSVTRRVLTNVFLTVAVTFFVGALAIKMGDVKILTTSANEPPVDSPKATPTLFIATVDNESSWRPDNVPAAWPKFTVLPNEKPLPSKTDVQKLALANDVLARWQSYKDGKTKLRPTMKESGQSISYLLTIDPKSPMFQGAWASFIQLRRVDREINKVERP